MKKSVFALILTFLLWFTLLTSCSPSGERPESASGTPEPAQTQSAQSEQNVQETPQQPAQQAGVLTITPEDRVPVTGASPEILWTGIPDTVPAEQELGGLEYGFCVSGTATGITLSEPFRPDVTEYSPNALAVGDTLTITLKAPEGMTVTVNGEEVDPNGVVMVPVDRIARDAVIRIAFSGPMGGGRQYVIHTYPEDFPELSYTVYQSEMLEYGVYSFSLSPYLIRMDTQGNVVYYRSFAHLDGAIVENLKPVRYEDGTVRFVYYLETNPELRSPNGGFSSGVYVIMDEQYRELKAVNLLANGWHGEGYLDQHAFVLLSDDHWISMSYTRRDVDNLPDSLGMTEPGYVWAGIIQEVENGQVLMEFDTTDYPLLYETAQENTNYDGKNYQDYVHINSVAVDPKDGNLLVSMRNQYAVYKLDRMTGGILWILGGAADQFGLPEEWLFKGQHAAGYTQDGTVTLFNNNTGSGQTTILELRLNETDKTVEMARQYVVRDYNGSYCGCIYEMPNGAHVIGWGMESTGTEKLVFSEINPDSMRELCTLSVTAPEGSPMYHSYRTFKSEF